MAELLDESDLRDFVLKKSPWLIVSPQLSTFEINEWMDGWIKILGATI